MGSELQKAGYLLDGWVAKDPSNREYVVDIPPASPSYSVVLYWRTSGGWLAASAHNRSAIMPAVEEAFMAFRNRQSTSRAASKKVLNV